MSCRIQTKYTAELILEYCARRLEPERAAALEAHAGVCSSCREMIERQRAVWQALENWDAIPLSGDFDRKLYARIDEEDRSSDAVKWVRSIAARCSPLSWRVPMAIAAACAALVLAVVIESPTAPRVVPPAEPQARMEHVDIEQVERTLDDMNMLRQLAPVLQNADQNSSSM